MNLREPCRIAALLVLAGAWAPSAPAQEMEPRSYSPNPVGVTFLIAAFARSTGGVLTDPSLPVDDVEAEVDTTALRFAHTFGFLGRSASFGVVHARISGHRTGTLAGEDAAPSRSGIAASKLKLT